MAHDVLDSLQALIAAAESGLVSEALRVRAQLELVRTLIGDGQLERAAQVLQAASTQDADSRRALAAQWLSLARAQAAHADATKQALAVQAFRQAAELDPAQGWPALGQYLQRQQRWTDAVEAWREAILARPTEPSAYLSLARVYERLGQPERALATYIRLIEAAPTARSYLTVAPRLQDLAERLPEAPATRQIKIALLSNATLDHLSSYVTVECFRAGLRPTIYQGPFDQTTQEMLNPGSGLYAFAPDVLICAIHPSRLFPHLQHDPFELSIDERRAEMDAGLQTLSSLLDTFTQRSAATVLLHNMVAPQHPAVGILDWRQELGQAELFGDINRRLAELVRTRYRSVYIVDEERIQARVGKLHATDARLWLTARVAWSEDVHRGLAREYVRYVKPLRGLNRKCIVLDLDNTLWGGVVGEDGIDGIQLGADAPGNAFTAFQRELERLARRGVLLAVCSKNNPEDVQPVLERHPGMLLQPRHIAAQRINWQPKATNVREIAAELNIGLDSLVFLDDNPVERAAVRHELPQVLVPELPTDPAGYRQALLDLDVFETLALTAEDRQRSQLYAEQAQRRQYEASSQSASLEDYLVGLQMVVDIAPADAGTLPRIAQLTTKTNQFNLTTRRYAEGDILAMQSKGADVFGMRVRDRFGDNGLVGVAILGPLADGVREIDTLLLSCRVMGRGVETALLACLADHARASGATRLHGRFIATAKNAPARDCYARHGFSAVDTSSDAEQVWELDLLSQSVTAPEWLSVHTPELVSR